MVSEGDRGVMNQYDSANCGAYRSKELSVLRDGLPERAGRNCPPMASNLITTPPKFSVHVVCDISDSVRRATRNAIRFDQRRWGSNRHVGNSEIISGARLSSSEAAR